MTAGEFIVKLNAQIGKNYVYGMAGGTLTQEVLDSLSESYPNMFTTTYYNKASGFIGSQCFDCSGLISYCAGSPRESSRGTINRCTNIHAYNGSSEVIPGAILYRSGDETNHVAVAVGNDRCIQALGINYGVINSSISGSHWDMWGLLPEVDYGNIEHWAQGALNDVLRYVANLPAIWQNLDAQVGNMTVGALLSLIIATRDVGRQYRYKIW